MNPQTSRPAMEQEDVAHQKQATPARWMDGLFTWGPGMSEMFCV